MITYVTPESVGGEELDQFAAMRSVLRQEHEDDAGLRARLKEVIAAGSRCESVRGEGGTELCILSIGHGGMHSWKVSERTVERYASAEPGDEWPEDQPKQPNKLSSCGAKHPKMSDVSCRMGKDHEQAAHHDGSGVVWLDSGELITHRCDARTRPDYLVQCQQEENHEEDEHSYRGYSWCDEDESGKDKGQPRLELVPLDFLVPLARKFEEGLKNGRVPNDWMARDPEKYLSIYRAALLRHYLAGDYIGVHANAIICAHLEKKLAEC